MNDSQRCIVVLLLCTLIEIFIIHRSMEVVIIIARSSTTVPVTISTVYYWFYGTYSWALFCQFSCKWKNSEDHICSTVVNKYRNRLVRLDFVENFIQIINQPRSMLNFTSRLTEINYLILFYFKQLFIVVIKLLARSPRGVFLTTQLCHCRSTPIEKVTHQNARYQFFPSFSFYSGKF